MPLDSQPRLCTRCGQRPFRYHELAVLGPFDTTEHFECEVCARTNDAMAESAEATLPNDFAHLGPIDFDVFRRSLPRAEKEPLEVLQLLVPLVRGIAAAHNQAIPADLEAWFARMAV
jgi:hypothetical protein